jgi:hypothetical protein
MKKRSLFNEKQMRYIQRTLRVSRQEIIDTINLSRVSAGIIAKYLKKSRYKGDIESRFA